MQRVMSGLYMHMILVYMALLISFRVLRMTGRRRIGENRLCGLFCEILRDRFANSSISLASIYLFATLIHDFVEFLSASDPLFLSKAQTHA